MPDILYLWKCSQCGNTVEVWKPLSKYDEPPNHSCTCGLRKWIKIFTATPNIGRKGKGHW